MIEKLDELKAKLDAYRPFSKEQAAKIDHTLIPQRIYYSNTFEDNTLTLEETSYYLETQRMVGGKLEREYDEVKGLLAAMLFTRELVVSGKDLDEDIIKQVHAVLTKPIEQQQRFQPGEYRSLDSIILGREGSRLSFVAPKQITAEIAALIVWYKEKGQQLHPLERAARFHYRLSLIHPFTDGNGRTARLLDDFILEKAGYGPLLVEDPKRYFEAHRQPDVQLPQEERVVSAETVELNNFISILGECSLKSMQLMLDVLEQREMPITVDLKDRLASFDKAISGETEIPADRRILEEKESTKLVLGRDLTEVLKGKLKSKYVQFIFSGPAKFSQNNHNYSPLIAEVSRRNELSYSAAETLYEYHIVPNLDQIEKSGIPMAPFMKLLAISIISHGDSVGIYSGLMPFEFGKVYIKQENREEIILRLDAETVAEMVGPVSYDEWDKEKLHEFIFSSLDSYFQSIEAAYQKENNEDK